MEILNESITTQEAQKAAYICSGENAIILKNVTQDNWVIERNKFLSNVQYNGSRSHSAIINVLLWFNQFNDN